MISAEMGSFPCENFILTLSLTPSLLSLFLRWRNECILPIIIRVRVWIVIQFDAAAPLVPGNAHCR
jgi:hypothetical protein